MSESRLVQVFLATGSSSPGIFEVCSDDDKNFTCNCPGFNVRGSCKHVLFVKERIEQNGGAYPVQLNSRVTQEEADEAAKDNNSFRAFLIKYGKIELF